jgi:hypothetical protein
MQLASGFLVEVGNPQQDKFIFDLGTGAYINLWATGVPFSKLNKVSSKDWPCLTQHDSQVLWHA